MKLKATPPPSPTCWWAKSGCAADSRTWPSAFARRQRRGGHRRRRRPAAPAVHRGARRHGYAEHRRARQLEGILPRNRREVLRRRLVLRTRLAPGAARAGGFDPLLSGRHTRGGLDLPRDARSRPRPEADPRAVCGECPKVRSRRRRRQAPAGARKPQSRRRQGEGGRRAAPRGPARAGGPAPQLQPALRPLQRDDRPLAALRHRGRNLVSGRGQLGPRDGVSASSSRR